MARLKDKAELIPVTNDAPDSVSIFLDMGRDYLSDLSSNERDRFLQSILNRQGEPDRWLLLLKHENEYVGFVHMKIDRDERPGWGFILEFYITPDKRKLGFGRSLFNLILDILRAQGVKNLWLLTNPGAEPFWHSLGFIQTGEIDRETGQKIMTFSIQDTSYKY